MVIMLYWMEHVKSDSKDLKTEIFSLVAKNAKEHQKKLLVLLNEDSIQMPQDLSTALNITRCTIKKRLHTIIMVQKVGIWVPYQLKERDIEKCLVTCEMLLKQ